MSAFYKKIIPFLSELKFSQTNIFTVSDPELFALSVFKILSQTGGGIVLVAENSVCIDEFGDDLRVLLGLVGDKRGVFEFPEYHQGKGLFQPDNDSDRHVVLAKLLANDEDLIILTSAAALIGAEPDLVY